VGGRWGTIYYEQSAPTITNYSMFLIFGTKNKNKFKKKKFTS
jgi:hypothetical protein